MTIPVVQLIPTAELQAELMRRLGMGRDATRRREDAEYLSAVLDSLAEDDPARAEISAYLDDVCGLPATIKLDTAGSSLFVAKVQADALRTIAIPLIEELSKRPQTQWGEIIQALRAKADGLEAAVRP